MQNSGQKLGRNQARESTSRRPFGGPEGSLEREGESGSVTGSSKGCVSFQIVIHRTAHGLRYAQVKQPLLDSQLRMFSVL